MSECIDSIPSAATSPNHLYTSKFSIPYLPHSPLQTLDLHIRRPFSDLASGTGPGPGPGPGPGLDASRATAFGYSLIYIHGGAFRDPLQTSLSILPSLPHLSLLPSPPRATAALNYRLSPYPAHSSQPSDPADASRNVRWPAHLDDVRAGIYWLLDQEHRALSQTLAGKNEEKEEGVEWWRDEFAKEPVVVLVGHSVGATMGLKMLLEKKKKWSWGSESESGWETKRRIQAVASLAGIANFAALRDAHLESRETYEDFSTGAFGREDEGGWEAGRVFPRRREGDGEEGDGNGLEEQNEEMGRDESEVEMEVVVLGQGRQDELVEWGQVELLREGFRREGWVEHKGREEEEEEEEGIETATRIGEMQAARECTTITQAPPMQKRRGERRGRRGRRGKKRMRIVELEGSHDDVWRQGGELARCVGVVVEMLAEGEGERGGGLMGGVDGKRREGEGIGIFDGEEEGKDAVEL